MTKSIDGSQLGIAPMSSSRRRAYDSVSNAEQVRLKRLALDSREVASACARNVSANPDLVTAAPVAALGVLSSCQSLGDRLMLGRAAAVPATLTSTVPIRGNAGCRR